NWIDSLNNNVVCSDSLGHVVVISGGGSNLCDSLHADFTHTVTGNTAHFTNTSNTVNTITPYAASWSFGDGSSTTQYNPSHTYAGPGTYTVTLAMVWVDSFTMAQFCIDSISHNVVIGSNPANNEISGNIYLDSFNAPNPTDSLKVWLILHDSTTNTLTAVDSLFLSAFNPHYGFHNAPAGTYYVKANVLGQTPGTTGYIPTYHFSSPYWGGATPIFHSGGASLHKHIMMLTGTVTSGPGFIGGNISMGAGKGTATGVPDLLVLLRNSSNEVITSTYTDANGDYAFSNVPEGSYNVYPEEMNYRTTPSSSITLASGSYSSNGNNFQQTEDEIVPTQVLGITRLSKEDGITVYPNPVAQTLYLESRNGRFSELALVNVLGQVVHQQPIRSGTNKIETGRLTAGIYYLLIKGSEGTRSVQISKK
ncbi:PKD domain-containing protein, partial [Taibaiella helva]|uniref:PKD domain-containing protein n=1 Tax=Taibaiella helva TaxID=2301235 RepID=UPI000E5756E3